MGSGEEPVVRILRKREVMGRVPYSSVHIDRLEKASRFPKRIRLGPAAVGWVEAEVDGWIEERIAERDKAASEEDARVAGDNS